MKEKTRLQKCIDQLINIAKSYNLNPSQFRYVTKIARKQGGYAIQKRPKKLPEFLNPAEMYHLLDISKQNSFDNLLIEFLIFTGLRINEARNLQIRDIDFSNNQLKVVSGKGGKDRFVPITNSLLQKMKLFLGRDGKRRINGFVFCRNDGNQYTKRALQTKIKKWINLSGFDKSLSTHSLRHTYACLLLSKGFSLEQIKLLMGHSSIKTTEIYAKLELGSVKQQYLQLMQY